LKPVWFREPSVNLGVGDFKGLPPHVTGKAFLEMFSIAPGSAEAYALTSEDFAALAGTYGRMGGIDRIATLIKAVRAARPDQTLLLDGGDTWQGSYTSLMTKGQDMVEVMNALAPDAMTGHWEFTYGTPCAGPRGGSQPLGLSGAVSGKWLTTTKPSVPARMTVKLCE
jgi:sulfur-oxidizing protein SoxB